MEKTLLFSICSKTSRAKIHCTNNFRIKFQVMLFISQVVFTLIFSFASVDLTLQDFKDGSKSAFLQTYGKNIFNRLATPNNLRGVNTVQNPDKEVPKEMSIQWPKGVVRYYVDNQTYDSFIVSSIHTAMKLIESDSCIRFEEESHKPVNKTWIHITNPNKKRECNHEPTFKQNGEITLVLGYDCLKHRDMLHSILHGIGLKDEVTHPQRDKYIRVLWSNILPAYRHLFRKQSIESSRNFVEYDPLSIMQFHDRAFSMNGRATVMPLEPGLIILPSDGLSQLDRMRLQLYFGHECNKRKVNDLLNSCKTSLGDKKLKGKEDTDSHHSVEDQKPKNKDNTDDNSGRNAAVNLRLDKESGAYSESSYSSSSGEETVNKKG